MAVYHEPGTVFFFEEIENGIHPNRVNRIIEYLEKISYQEKKQFVFTTHSPRVINALRPKDIISVQKSERGSALTNLNDSEQIGRIRRPLDSNIELNEVMENSL